MKNILILLGVLFVFLPKAKSQTKEIFLPLAQRIYFEKVIYTSQNLHGDNLPLTEKDSYNKLIDSIKQSLSFQAKSNFLDYLLNKNLFEKKGKNFQFTLNPVMQGVYLADKKNDFYDNYIGLTADVGTRKFHFNFTYAHAETNFAVPQNEIISGWGYAYKNKSCYFNNLVQGYVNFYPRKKLGLEVGYGKQFIGYGYRSMLLSDNAANYPYFKMTAKIWKFKYMMLIAQLNDIRFSNGNPTFYTHKYMALHYLSWNVAKWFSGGFFESVVWESRDGGIVRDFEPYYLNPVVFYRPMEFSQGSADNSLMGINLKFQPFKKVILYQQTLLDEFLLKEFINQSGWWGNKYALQFGLRYFDACGLKNLQVQTEFNLARPYTYSHTTRKPDGVGVANYAHFNQPLADPLGANFYEAVFRLSYFHHRFGALFSNDFSKKGYDINGRNYGGNVYDDYQNRAKGYGNFIGQGNLIKQFSSELKISYLINSAWHLKLFLGDRYYKNLSARSDANYIFFGISTNLMNRYFDY